ncbi:hypothetical protein TNCV_1525701 [Trichonephila clavipes]|nr:hypothetical protein TNCV_1525701 [Trichonephila clavipes]
MATVNFLHPENPLTYAGDEPAPFGAQSHQQSNHATQPADRVPRRRPHTSTRLEHCLCFSFDSSQTSPPFFKE